MGLLKRMFGKKPANRGPSDAERYARAFAAARIDRLTASWMTESRRINDELVKDLDALRDRARSLENNNDHAVRYLNMVETNVVGSTGPRLISKVDNASGAPDELARDVIEAAFKAWGKRGVCEVSGQYSFIELCWLIVRGEARDGEFVLRRLTGANARNRFGYELQIVDVSRLATRLNREADGGMNAIRMGVEVDQFDRAIAYHLAPSKFATPVRIPADEIIHRFRAYRAEQSRGIPRMHASMLSMHMAGEFAMSALTHARDSADRLGFFETPDGEPPNIGAGVIGADGEEEAGGDRIATSTPGYWETLPTGTHANRLESNYPNEVFEPFLKFFDRRVASGLNVSYPALCNNHSDLNYNSIRATQQDDQDQWRREQRRFEEQWLDAIFDDWLKWSLMSMALRLPNGARLPAQKIEKFQAHGWQHRGWQSNDPKKDVDAFSTEYELGVNSLTAYASRHGREVEEVAQELRREAGLFEGIAPRGRASTAPASVGPDEANPFDEQPTG